MMPRTPQLDPAERARSAGFAIRPAVTADAARMAAVHVQVWREAYRGLMRQSHLDALDIEDRTRSWRRILARPDRPPTWIGLDPVGTVVALATAGPARDDDPPTDHELWAVNVLASAHGTGLADLLMTELVADHPAYLWVVEGNRRAIAFYTRHGFRLDGGRKTDQELGAEEVRMTRRPA